MAIAGVLTLLDDGKGRSQQPVPGFLQKSQPAVPDFLQQMPLPAGQPANDGGMSLVRDFLVNPDVGPWMICIASYVGPESAKMAREFVLVLRDPVGPYKMNAYVFNRGAEERQKEQQRIEQYKQQIREKCKAMGIDVPPKIRVPRMRIEDQCAVLVGGFKDMAAARRYLDHVRKFDTPDPNKVKMDSASVMELDKKGKATKAEGAYINPFKHSFVVPNPTTPPPSLANNTAPDPFLKTLNANEKFSLLKCPRPYTLLVKQFQGAAVVQQDAGGGTFGKVGAGKNAVNGATLDNSARCAQSLAEMLSKFGFSEVYVLHTRYNSLVTVGSFTDDKNPKQDLGVQRALQTWARLQQQVPQEQLAQLQLLPEPLPMIVPRPK
jgi:hypothetical protein